MNFFLSDIKCLYQYDKTILYTIEGLSRIPVLLEQAYFLRQ